MDIAEILRGKNARIISVRLNQNVEAAIRLLYREGVGAVVVQDVCATEGNTLVGILSERDIVHILVEHGTAALRGRTVADFMSAKIVSCGPHDTLEHGLDLMLDNHIRHLVVCEDNTLIGVVSMREIMAGIRGRQESSMGDVTDADNTSSQRKIPETTDCD